MFNTTGTFADLVDSILNFFNLLIPVLVAFGVVFFMYGTVQYIYHRKPKNYQQIVWSLIAIFVMLSAWGLLRLLMSLFLIA